MTGLTPPDFPINAETLIGEARAARERQADEQVAAAHPWCRLSIKISQAKR